MQKLSGRLFRLTLPLLLLVLAVSATATSTSTRTLKRASGPSTASTLPASVGGRYVIAGRIEQMLRLDNTIYVGGEFYRIADRTGSAIVVPVTGGAPEPIRAEVSGGSVRAAVADDHGGWYVGGSFSSVGGVVRTGLAHLHADGTLDPAFAPAGIDSVRSLALVGTTLYVGGLEFAATYKVEPVLRALDAGTGAKLPIPFVLPEGGRCALALVASGGRLYVAFGDAGVAAYNAATGARLWTRPVGATQFEDEGVGSLALTSGRLLIGGHFSDAGSENLEALDPTSGTPLAPALVVKPGVGAIAVAGGTVYLMSPRGIMTLDLSTGAVRLWTAAAPFTESALATDGTKLYFIGASTRPVLAVRVYAVQAGAPSSKPTPISPDLAASGGRRVFALAPQGRRLLVGGGFTGAGGAVRRGLAAFDAVTGTLQAWGPNAASGVRSLAASGRTIYVGGQFKRVAGAPRNGLAAISAGGTGRLLKWHPRLPYADVHALAVSGNRVFVGGSLKLPGAKPKTPFSHLVALSTKSGAIVRFSPRVGQDVFVLAVWRRTLLVAGHSLFAYPTAGDGRHPTWLRRTGGTSVPVVFALAIRGSTLYAGGRFGTVDKQPRQNLAAFALDHKGALLSFAPKVDGTVTSLASIGSQLVYGRLALTPWSTAPALGALEGDGTASSWGVEMPRSDFPVWGGDAGCLNVSVDSIVPTADGVLVAGSFDWLGPPGNQAAGGLGWLR